MKKRILIISIAVITLILSACQDVLDLEPNDRVTATQLFADETGLQMVLATLYNRIPIEDFNYVPEGPFNITGTGNNSDGGWNLGSHTDEMVIQSNAGGHIGRVTDGYWDYEAIRYVNGFFANLKDLKGDVLTDAAYNRLWSEAHWIRGYMYYALVSRYGGVPIIKNVQEIGGDNSQLYVARSTEKETWDFVLAECDSAIMYLPEDADGYRATKWAAYALKSRAALHAASLAKYWNNAPLIGEAVTANMVGMSSADANGYYSQCLNASKAIIDNSGKSLYKPNPADAAEAAVNFQEMFETPPAADVEVVYKKGYVDGVSSGDQGHQMDFYGYPAQMPQATSYVYGRMGVTLDLVNTFEDYTDDGTGTPGVLLTRGDGQEDIYLSNPANIDVSVPYVHYDSQYDIFTGKDARLFASVNLPGAPFKGITINCQGGLIESNGNPVIYSEGSSSVGLDGQTYYAYGTHAANGFSAFGAMGSGLSANSTSTGFIIKKFLQEKTTPTPSRWGGSTQDYIAFRMAEIYLNYAEAAIESGQGDAALAKTYLNSIRKRAAHTDEIPATVENIVKERFVELAFEQRRYWDLVRRREMHTTFNDYRRKSLVPILDLRENPPKYIFVKVNNFYDEQDGGVTFQQGDYYLPIPGVSSNKLIQNPGY
ncbi:MAG: RagB/SusD family nutrient uptake outer membrane protein [Mariniphaga sp.]|nr:RagB/SusD family nutrient uptake outer membrane protein [Mariniphaga sp.]